MSGDLGVRAENSARATSFIANAQAVGQQQILSAMDTFQTAISNASNQAQGNQTALLGKAVDLQQANKQFDLQQKQFQFSQDQFLTQALGTLYQGGTDTGKETLAGKSTDLQLAAGTESLKKAQFDNNIIMDSNGNPTDIGNAYISCLGADYNLNATQKNAALQAFQGYSNETTALQNILAGVAKGNADSIKQWSDIQTQKGNSYGIYWADNAPTLNKDGSITRNVAFDDKALSQKGLYLNINFDSQAYKDTTANMKDGTKPDQVFANQIIGAIQKGETPEVLNKIGLESNDGNVTLLAVKNTAPDGTKVYAYKLIDLTQVGDGDKVKIKQSLYALNPSDPKILSKVDSVLKTTVPQFNGENKYRDISGSEFMDYLTNDNYKSNAGSTDSGGNVSLAVSFKQARENRMSDSLPKTPQLLAGIFAGMAGENTYSALVSNGVIDGKDNFNFINLQNNFTPNQRASLGNLSASGIAGFNNDTQAIDRAVKLFKGTATKGDFGSIDPSGYNLNTTSNNYSFDKNTQGILDALSRTKNVMKLNIKSENYLNDAFTGFIQGVFGNQIDVNTAKGINALINKL